jgi:putative nucleotidyltransferase with HDIG domain
VLPAGDGFLVDPFGGLADLERRSLRAVGSPVERLSEDPLRIARLFRLAAELRFRPEAATKRAAKALAPDLGRISRERVRDELSRLVLADGLWTVGEDVAHVLLPAALPLWRELRIFEEGYWQGSLVGRLRNHVVHKPVDLHSVLAASRVPNRPVLRWAALLHDLGKPRTFSLSSAGRVQFHGHEAVSAGMAREALVDLRFSPSFVERVAALVEVHLFPWEEASETGYRRLIRRLGEEGTRDLLELHRADVEASTPLGWPTYPVVRKALEEILRQKPAVTERALAIDGREIMEILGIGPSREVGEVLRGLLEWVLVDPGMNDRARLRELVRTGRWRETPWDGMKDAPDGPP